MLNYIKNNDIILGLISAIFFSTFIYLSYFGISFKLINTLLAISALGLFLYIPKKAILVAGFFIGIFWFYWVGYSFKYNGVGWMLPIVIFTFGLFYSLLFGLLALTKEVYIRAVLLFLISFIEPFSWNWMQIELIFIDSYIGILKYQLVIVLLALSLPNYINQKYKFIPLLLIILALDINYKPQQEAPIKIKLIQTDVKQNEKWLPQNQLTQVLNNIKYIEKAIDANYDLVVLPESTFPLFMNKYPSLYERLTLLSKKISIVAGALYRENNLNYNVSYLFQNGDVKIAKKLVLVPFGEYIPLPKFARKFINDTFFASQPDFVPAKKPTDFMIKGVKFRNAICYEATTQDIYVGEVKYVLAMSNNAWFSPSIEPTLQKLLMRYYSKKNHITIYHSANTAGTGIIR